MANSLEMITEAMLQCSNYALYTDVLTYGIFSITIIIGLMIFLSIRRARQTIKNGQDVENVAKMFPYLAVSVVFLIFLNLIVNLVLCPMIPSSKECYRVVYERFGINASDSIKETEIFKKLESKVLKK